MAVDPVASGAPQQSDARKKLGFAVMALGMFVALLDIQIVASSLAEIGAGLAATPDEIALIQTWYLIAEVIMIPLSGWFARMASTRWLFTASAAGFTLASIACGLAWNLESMIVFRTLQGFLGGAMIPMAFATGYVLFPGPKQATVVAIPGMVATCAPALGPTIGGYVTEALGWRWLFFVNLFPGFAITVLIPRLIEVDKPDLSLLRQFDALGMLTLAIFLGVLQYVLEDAPGDGWFDDERIRWLSLVSLFAGLVFIIRSLQRRDPLVDLRALGNRNFTIGCLLSFVTGIGLYGMVYLTALFLGTVRGWNALQIGATVFVFGVSQVLATPLVALASRKIEPRVVLTFGFALYGVSTAMLGHITSDWGFEQLLASQLVRGVASMSCIITVTNLALGALPPSQLKNASGLFNLMRNLGGAIGLATLSTLLFYNRFALHAQQLGDSLSLARLRMLPRFGMPDGDDALALSRAAHLGLGWMHREVLTLSFADCFLAVAACFFGALLLIPWVRPQTASAHAVE